MLSKDIHVQLCKELLILVEAIRLVQVVLAHISHANIFVFEEVQLFSRFVDEEIDAGRFIHYDNTLFQIVKQLFIASAQNFSFHEKLPDDIDN